MCGSRTALTAYFLVCFKRIAHEPAHKNRLPLCLSLFKRQPAILGFSEVSALPVTAVFLHLLIQHHHLCIQHGNNLGALHQIIFQMLRRVPLELLVHLMLQTGPEVHGNSPDLDLHLRIQDPVGQIYRHCHDHMITLITALLRFCYVIFH